MEEPQETTDQQSEEPSAAGEPQRMFDKPNLQLSDPDPYAFANRIRKLILLASVLACVAIAPFLSRMFAYQIRRGQMQAEVEAATEALGDLAPRLSEFQMASRLVTKKVGPGVVSIFIPRHSHRGPEGQGSGFVVDADGYVLTNYHVVKGASRILVQFATGETSEAALVGADEATDLAVLKVDNGNLTVAEWGDSSQLEAGDLVWALGSPYGLESSVTFGIVSATARRRGGATSIKSMYQEYLQSDAAINPGNSGGPLVNLAGEVIGVNTAIFGEAYQGISFAIPSNLAREMYEQLREHGFIERGFLGMEPIRPPASVRQRLGVEKGEGVLVKSIVRESPAEKGGLFRHDLILSWNDHRAEDPNLLSRAIAATEVGSTADVLIRRLVNGEVVDQTLSIRVGRKAKTEARPKP